MRHKYKKFVRSKKFIKSFDKLTQQDQNLAIEKFKIFRIDPFDPRLDPHPIKKLTLLYGQPVYSVFLRGDLRSVFLVTQDIVVRSLDIGGHKIYESIDFMDKCQEHLNELDNKKDTAQEVSKKLPTAEEAFRKSLKKFNLLYKKLADYDSSND